MIDLRQYTKLFLLLLLVSTDNIQGSQKKSRLKMLKSAFGSQDKHKTKTSSPAKKIKKKKKANSGKSWIDRLKRKKKPDTTIKGKEKQRKPTSNEAQPMHRITDSANASNAVNNEVDNVISEQHSTVKSSNEHSMEVESAEIFNTLNDDHNEHSISKTETDSPEHNIFDTQSESKATSHISSEDNNEENIHKTLVTDTDDDDAPPVPNEDGNPATIVHETIQSVIHPENIHETSVTATDDDDEDTPPVPNEDGNPATIVHETIQKMTHPEVIPPAAELKGKKNNQEDLAQDIINDTKGSNTSYILSGCTLIIILGVICLKKKQVVPLRKRRIERDKKRQ